MITNAKFSNCPIVLILVKFGSKIGIVGNKIRFTAILISLTLPYFFCACVRNTPKFETFVIGKWKLVSCSLVCFRCSPRPKMTFIYVVNVYSDMSLSKGLLGSRGGGGGRKHLKIN